MPLPGEFPKRGSSVEVGASLNLRVPESADALSWCGLFDDREVMRYIGDGAIRSPEWYLDFVARQSTLFDERGYCLFAIEAEGETVGFAGLQPWSQQWGPEGRLELGWRLGKAHWGRGYAFAAASWLLSTANGSGIAPISMIHRDNSRSRRLAERLGGEVGAEHCFGDGQLALEYCYPGHRPARQ